MSSDNTSTRSGKFPLKSTIIAVIILLVVSALIFAALPGLIELAVELAWLVFWGAVWGFRIYRWMRTAQRVRDFAQSDKGQQLTARSRQLIEEAGRKARGRSRRR